MEGASLNYFNKDSEIIMKSYFSQLFHFVKRAQAGAPAVLALVAGILANCGGQPAAPQIRAENIWSRPAVALDDEMGGMGVVYLTLINEGGAPDRLLSAQSAVAEVVEVHGMKMEGGRMKMQAFEGGYEIPARGQVEFKSGGHHMMLIRLKRNLEKGDRFKVILKFEKSGTLAVESEVR